MIVTFSYAPLQPDVSTRARLPLKYKERAKALRVSLAVDGITTQLLSLPHGPGLGNPAHRMYTSPPEPTAIAMMPGASYTAA